MMNYCLTVSLLNSKEIPESRFLFDEILDIIVVFEHSLDSLEETDGRVFRIAFLEFGEKSLP